MHALSVIVGSSLFGIRAWCRVYNLGKTCVDLGTMVIKTMSSSSGEEIRDITGAHPDAPEKGVELLYAVTCKETEWMGV